MPRCTTSFPRSVEGCLAADPFATADQPAAYAKTRPRGWRDLNETAMHTVRRLGGMTQQQQQQQPAGGYGAGSGAVADARWAQTVTAWVALSRCTRAIVAPIPSAFSDSAAAAAGVPVVGCCSEQRQLLSISK